MFIAPTIILSYCSHSSSPRTSQYHNTGPPTAPHALLGGAADAGWLIHSQSIHALIQFDQTFRWANERRHQQMARKMNRSSHKHTPDIHLSIEPASHPRTDNGQSCKDCKVERIIMRCGRGSSSTQWVSSFLPSFLPHPLSLAFSLLFVVLFFLFSFLLFFEVCATPDTGTIFSSFPFVHE